MNEIKVKLDLLVESGIIDSTDRETIEAWLELIVKRELFDLTKVDTFVTHSAMVLSREKSNQEIAELDAVIFDSVEEKVRNEANEIIAEMKSIHAIKDFEEGYILIHLCNLLSK
ncbi:hypothetical protein [Anaerorhabdus sp.]|uniref:hypothetical protein n=1 Tax=Anaerorhabdus sp. TaxID=1872524 RepID=UPI002FCC5466